MFVRGMTLFSGWTPGGLRGNQRSLVLKGCGFSSGARNLRAAREHESNRNPLGAPRKGTSRWKSRKARERALRYLAASRA